MKTLALLLLLSLLPAAAAPAPPALTWTQHRDTLLKDPDLLRYYALDAATSPDLTGKGGPLSYVASPPAGTAPETVRLVEGRWPGRNAVQLDAGAMVGDAFNLPGRSFTVEIWFRKEGPGLLTGNGGAADGTIVSIGGGYWDGWRVTTSYPDRSVGLEIGRPAPSSSIGIGKRPVSDNAWHHLAATWDGHEMRLYTDGLLFAAGNYDGVYTAPTADPHFRVGFAGYGWGSAKLDVDEVAAWSRARSAAEIMADASGNIPLPSAAATLVNSAAAHGVKDDWASRAADYTAILAQPNLSMDIRVAARLGLGEALQAQSKWSAAAATFVAVLQAGGAPEGLRSAAVENLLAAIPHSPAGLIPTSTYEDLLASKDLPADEKRIARLGLARSLRAARNFPGAEQQYRQVLAANLPPRDGLDVRLELGDCLLQAGQPARAQDEYSKIGEDAPVEYRCLAALRTARIDLAQKNYAAAKIAYGKLQSPDIPAHFQWVAGERLRELDRLQQGLPARDPTRSSLQLPAPQTEPQTLYVAPNGLDTNDGTRDHPFATLAHARDALFGMRAQGNFPAAATFAVILRGGSYHVTQTLTFNERDSAPEGSSVLYAAASGETVSLDAGTRLSGFRPVASAAVLARIPPEARGKVLQVELKGMGITNYGQVAPSGQRPELFFNGRPMPLARYPNEGYLKIGDLVGGKSTEISSGQGNSVGKFTYEGERPARWKDEADPWLYGYWYWDWADAYEKVESIDTQKHIISLAPPYHNYGYRKDQRYFALNLLSELDAPGEWYLDRQSGILYFYPPSDPAKAVIELSLLDAPVVQMKNVSNVTFQGLTLQNGRGNAVEIAGGNHCILKGCTIRRFGGDGVTISGGSGCGVLGCDIYTIGRGVIRVSGGDRKTLTPGSHFVENCHIYDFSRVDRTYTPAVWLDGVGNRIVHNVFNDSPHQAMRIEGNDHLIEFNEVYNVVTDSDDQGGLDMWNNPGYRGNIIRYNFWHDIGSGFGLGQAGVRLDDAISGVTIYGNVFYRCSGQNFGGVQINGGKDDIIDNNLFVDCKHAISFSAWGEKRWKEFLSDPGMVRTIHGDVDVSSPPYSTRYPDLARLTEDHDRNYIWRNLAVDCGDFLASNPGTENLADNHTGEVTPGFADPTHRNLTLDAAIYTSLGMDPIPFNEIGLYGPDRQQRLARK